VLEHGPDDSGLECMLCQQSDNRSVWGGVGGLRRRVGVEVAPVAHQSKALTWIIPVSWLIWVICRWPQQVD